MQHAHDGVLVASPLCSQRREGVAECSEVDTRALLQQAANDLHMPGLGGGIQSRAVVAVVDLQTWGLEQQTLDVRHSPISSGVHERRANLILVHSVVLSRRHLGTQVWMGTLYHTIDPIEISIT